METITVVLLLSVGNLLLSAVGCYQRHIAIQAARQVNDGTSDTVAGQRSQDLADVRGALWEVVAALKEGDMDPEAGQQAVSALDSLIHLTKVEPGGGAEALEEARDTRG